MLPEAGPGVRGDREVIDCNLWLCPCRWCDPPAGGLIGRARMGRVVLIVFGRWSGRVWEMYMGERNLPSCTSYAEG